MGNTHRQCAVRINNDTQNYVLRSPNVYIYSGRCEDTLPDSVRPSTDGFALFIKTPHTACGSVGVFTYDLFSETTEKVEKKIAVMFSNPYDFNFYYNLFAVGIFDKKQFCDHSLYDKMYYQITEEFVRGNAGCGLTHSRDDVTITAIMTDTYQPKLDVNISSREI